jgi:hypothetical protein
MTISKHLEINLSPHTTTVRDLLLHVNSIKQINDLLLAPNGTVLVSDEQFLSVSTGKRPVTWNWSNFNPIMAGLLCKKISGISNS